jgi:hypothetical protein
MAGKAWEGTQLLPENRTTNDIVRSSKLDGTGGNGFYIDAVNIALRDIQRTLNQAQALLASSGAAITAGQGYIIDNGGVLQLPTGISLMRVIGINLPAGVKGFDPNAEAYITALATYVPCTYDVGTNTISGKVIVWSGDVSQTGTSNPTIDRTHINLFASDPVITYSNTGLYNMNFPVALFSAANYARVSVIVDGVSGLAFNTEYGGAKEILIRAYKIGNSEQDDVLSNAYVEITISL